MDDTGEDVVAEIAAGAGDVVSSFEAAWIAFAHWWGDNAVEAAIAVVVAIMLFLAFVAARRWVSDALNRIKWRDQSSYAAIAARAVRRVNTVFLLFSALVAASEVVTWPQAVTDVIHFLFLVAAVVQLAVVVREVLASVIARQARRRGADAAQLRSAISIVQWFISVAVWSIALLVILDNVGIDITALVAGLGVGGVAIGLAAQGTFTDLFSALSILFDKPFRRGDFIVTDEIIGDVEEIGLKTTRVRALSGEQVVIANSNLLDRVIHNYERLSERRVLFHIGVTYQTPAEKLEKIAEWIKNEIDNLDGMRFDRAHLSDFGASSLNFEVVFFVLSRAYHDFMDAKHRVNLALFRRFAAEGVSFAYPTQTLMLADPGGAAVDPRSLGETALERMETRAQKRERANVDG